MLFIGKRNLVAVYEDKLAVDIPFEIHTNKAVTFGDLVKKREYEEVLRKVNDILPEKIEKYAVVRSEEHTSELQSRQYLVCRLLLEKTTATPCYTLTSSASPT